MARRADCPTWQCASCGQVPPNAIPIGRSGSNGELMYVGRAAHHSGDLIPGKVVPSHQVCYVGCGNKECGERSYEVLVGSDRCVLTWVPASNGQVPAGAIEAGRVASSGEPLYIARGHPSAEPNGIHGGKVHPSHGCCYIPYAGIEHAVKQYEVLCQQFIFC